MKKKRHTPSIHKVRRNACGGKPAEGHELQRRAKRIRRADPARVHIGEADPSLTSAAGLVGFGRFVSRLGVPEQLHSLFDSMKTGRTVVYPMSAQLQLLLDLYVSGHDRVFDLELLARDALIVHLAGGSIPSVDTMYRDLQRFDAQSLEQLEAMMAGHGLSGLAGFDCVHLDIDTTVEPLFGEQQGALRGHNPRYHGRPSYHPIVARVAETDTIVGAKLRPGNTGLGHEDIPTIEHWIDRVREAVGPSTLIVVRIDAGADFGDMVAALERKGVHYIIKARLSPDLAGAVACHTCWHTVDIDAFNRPTRQVATIGYVRNCYHQKACYPRLVAVRSRDRDTGKQVYLWNHLAFSVQVYVTNDWTRAEEEIAQDYDRRAGIEPLIGELKHNWTIGKVPTRDFDGNEAAFLVKLLAYNLMRRYVDAKHPALRAWRARWIRAAAICIPGRIIRSGRKTILRAMPRVFAQLE